MNKLIPIVLSLLPTLAIADLTKPIASCAAIDGDLARLACYDKIAKANGLDGLQREPVSVDGIGKWRVSSNTNPIDDSKTVVISLTADSGQNDRGKKPNLVIRCESNTTEMFIIWDDYLGGKVRVLTRIGKQDAITKKWTLSSDSTASFHPNGTISFVKGMTKSNSFIAQVTPYNANPITAIFDTTGLENALKPLRETCGW
jgi:type VI secretion system protein VasI